MLQYRSISLLIKVMVEQTHCRKTTWHHAKTCQRKTVLMRVSTYYVKTVTNAWTSYELHKKFLKPEFFLKNTYLYITKKI